MRHPALNTLVLMTFAALSATATAQSTYKCGDAYSQLPCPGGVAIDATDQRSNAQKTQTDLATSRDARNADAMEKARLQQEKKDMAANPRPAKPASADAASAPRTTQAKKKKKQEPEYFTAQVPGEKKKKPAPKKTVDKKEESKS